MSFHHNSIITMNGNMTTHVDEDLCFLVTAGCTVVRTKTQ